MTPTRGAPAGPADDEEWRALAACADPDVDARWFDERLDRENDKQQAARHEKAAAVCDTCTVGAKCLAAFVRGTDEGVRNGRRLPPLFPHPGSRGLVDIRHGTDVGYRSHLRRHETPCAECSEAAGAVGGALWVKSVLRHVRVLTPCGTPGALKRHRSAGEQCAVCLEARRESDRSYRNRRQAS